MQEGTPGVVASGALSQETIAETVALVGRQV
jgi:hypothetical protein